MFLIPVTVWAVGVGAPVCAGLLGASRVLTARRAVNRVWQRPAPDLGEDPEIGRRRIADAADTAERSLAELAAAAGAAVGFDAHEAAGVPAALLGVACANATPSQLGRLCVAALTGDAEGVRTSVELVRVQAGE